jgi:hypothetical protein
VVFRFRELRSEAKRVAEALGSLGQFATVQESLALVAQRLGKVRPNAQRLTE